VPICDTEGRARPEVFEERVLSSKLGSKMGEVTGDCFMSFTI